MSSRTIIELNHDFAGEIERNPDEFLRLIHELLNSGYNGNPENESAVQLQDNLRRFGVTLTPTTHHSDRRRVVGKWFEVEL